MSTYSRRQLEALGMPLGESATRHTPGMRNKLQPGGGGGGGTTESTVTNYNIPDWLRPQTEALLGGATPELFQTDPSGNITGVKPYTPYSTNPQDYVAGFSPMQQQAFSQAANMQQPGQIQDATNAMGSAIQGSMGTAGPAYQYGAAGAQYGGQGAQYGALGTTYGNSGAQFGMLGAEYGDVGNQYGGLGAGYGGLGADYGAQGVQHGNQGAQYGDQGVQVGSQGMQYGDQGAQYGAQGAQAGFGYADQATDPNAIADYMSPYMQNVVDAQKSAAVRDAQVANLTNNLAASRQGTYGGARQLLAQTERERNLQDQLATIQATGSQAAFDDARRAQQYATDAAMRGAQVGMEGAQSGMQGAQVGLQGVQTGIQGAQTGIQGAQAGMQGAGLGIQGAQTGIQGAQAGMQGAGLGIQGAQTGIQGAQTGIQGSQAGMQGAQIGLQGVNTAQQGYGQAGQMAQGLAGIGATQQGLDLDRLQALYGLGSQQQGYEQSVIDASVGNYNQAQDNALRMLEAYNSLLHGYASPSVTQTTRGASPSALSQLAGLGTAGAGLYGVMGRKKGGIIRKRRQGIDTLAIRKAKKGSKS